MAEPSSSYIQTASRRWQPASSHAALRQQVFAQPVPAPTTGACWAGLAEEAAVSRIYGGIHHRFDCDTSLELGHQVAAWAWITTSSGVRHPPWTRERQHEWAAERRRR